MAGVLEALGKNVMIVNAQADAAEPGVHRSRRRSSRPWASTLSRSDLEGIEVLMVLDTSAWAQLGTMAEVVRATKAHKLILDHHVGEDDLGAELFKDSHGRSHRPAGVRSRPSPGRASSRAEIAMPLFAAIATDTGWFRFGSTSELTMRYAGDLIEAGAVPAEIYGAALRARHAARLQLRGRILARTKTELDGPTGAHTAALAEDFEATGALPSRHRGRDQHDAGASRALEVAVILVEQPTGGFKLSFRSRTPEGQLQRDWPRILAAADTKRRPAHSPTHRWPEAQTPGA